MNPYSASFASSSSLVPRRLTLISLMASDLTRLKSSSFHPGSSTMAHYVQLERSPESINKLFRLYDAVTVEDVRQIAQKYFIPEARTIVTLSSAKEK